MAGGGGGSIQTWMGRRGGDEADMKVGLFHGQAAGLPRPLNGNASTLM